MESTTRRLFALLFLTSSLSAAQSSGGLGLCDGLRRAAAAPASVWVEMESDNKEAILIRHVGTAYGTVGGQSAVITTRLPSVIVPGDSPTHSARALPTKGGGP